MARTLSPPVAETLIILREKAGLTQQQLAARTGFSVRRIQQFEQGKARGIYPEGRRRLAAVLGVDPEELDRQAGAHDELPAMVVPARVVAGGSARQDWKNVIRDESLSVRILKAKTVPTFAECVAASVAFTPADVKQKDAPFISGLSYNHFFQPSAIISVDMPGDGPHVVAYHRDDESHSRKRHTRGWAILWAVSFVYNIGKLVTGTRMDRWMDQVAAHPSRAAERFTVGVGSVMADLLSYKIDLRQESLKTEPFAVVTRDERDREIGVARVYTQYVFCVRAAVGESYDATARFLVKHAPGSRISLLPERPMSRNDLMNQFCDKTTGRLNLMDVLAWEGMFERCRRREVQSATFTRGFSIV